MSLECPDWSSRADRNLYEELYYKFPKRNLTEQEQSFVNWMYHFEEGVSEYEGDE